MPLASAYVRAALMNATPVSGPIASSKNHQAREAQSSRHSFLSKTANERFPLIFT
jgi:hypothetical protein